MIDKYSTDPGNIPEILKPLSSLRHLTFDIIQLGGDFDPKHSTRWIRRLLESLSCPRLTTLKFKCYAEDSKDIQDIIKSKREWTNIERILAEQPHYESLRTVILHIGTEHGLPPLLMNLLEEDITRELPSFQDKLVIEWGESVTGVRE